MKQFNLEAALAGEPVITRTGRPVTQLTKFDLNSQEEYPLRGVVDGRILSFTKTGTYYPSSNHDFDLFMAGKEKTIYLNVYKALSGDKYRSYGYPTERQADLIASGTKGRVTGKAIPLTFEE